MPIEFAQGKGLPPGLRELAEEKHLSDAQIEQLHFAYSTLRGRRPATIEEWRVIYHAVKGIWEEEEQDAG